MSADVRTHVPPPRRSVRPADLDSSGRVRVRGSGDGDRPRARRREPGTIVLIVGALVVAFAVKALLAQAFYIPSGSMIPTLQIGDRVIVEKVSFRFGEPQRGDVVVFHRPGVQRPSGLVQAAKEFLQGLGLMQPDANIDLIKRIIGLPGETIRLERGQLWVDGVSIAEPYVVEDWRDYGPVTVPDGHYLMLGDNRPNSDDSRFSLGMVPRDHLVGKAFTILWPPGHARLGLSADYGGS